MKGIVRSISFFGAALLLSGSATASEATGGTGAEAALAKLIEGNKRYVEMTLAHPDQSASYRADIAKGQKPFAIILGCSDSRVPPEVVFDQGLGSLFVVRVAGNVVDDLGLASIEYAVEHLGSRLIMVLGHERCGAVTAAVGGGEAPGHLGALMDALKPAVEKARGHEGDGIENAIRANVELMSERLRHSKPILAELVEKHEVKVVGARYDLDTGAVEVLP